MAETIFIKYYEDTDCLHGYGVERTVELTRQEAIERMAKAMCLTYSIDDECDCKNCEKWKYQEQKAEAALNAIVSIIPQEEEE